MRAFPTVHCQSTARRFTLTWLAQAKMSDAAVDQILTGQTTQFALGHVEPATVLGA